MSIGTKAAVNSFRRGGRVGGRRGRGRNPRSQRRTLPGVQPSSCGNINNVNQCWDTNGGSSCEWCYWQSGMPGECLDIGTCNWNSCYQAQTPQSCKANQDPGYCIWCTSGPWEGTCMNTDSGMGGPGGCDTPTELMPFSKGGRVGGRANPRRMNRGGRANPSRMKRGGRANR